MRIAELTGTGLSVPSPVHALIDGLGPAAVEEMRRLHAPILDKWAAIRDVAAAVAGELDAGAGCVIVRGVAFSGCPTLIRDASLVCLCSALGTVIGHDAMGGAPVWQITPDPGVTREAATFSQHDGEAEFHTDSQYRAKPERYFALLVVRAARDGGGMSRLLGGADLLEALATEPDGDDVIDLLQHPVYPFCVPAPFGAAGSPAVAEIVTAPIIAREPLVRFRYDTLQAGFAAAGWAAESPYRFAAHRLRSGALSSAAKKEIHLTDGDLILINNHEVLHGRSAFTDQSRLLLRVRFDRVPATRRSRT